MNTLIQDGENQSGVDAESGNAGGGQSQDIFADNTVQPNGQEGNAVSLGDDNLPPELLEARKKLMQDYHEKTQKLAAERKESEKAMNDLKYSDTLLKQLMEEPWFKKAYEGERNQRNGQLPEVSDEQFENIRSDKRAFMEFVQSQVEGIVNGKYGNVISNQNKELKTLKTEREIDGLAGKYSDFKKVHDNGNLDTYLNKGYSLKAAYAEYKLDHPGSNNSVEREAERILAERRAGAVDKGGVTQVRGQRIMKAKGLSDALDQAYQARLKGETNFKIERA